MIGEEEHYKVLEHLAKKFNQHGMELLLLGSSSVLYRYGHLGMTKDIDVHPFPMDPYEKFYDELEEMVKEMGGSFRLETDGSSITLSVELDSKIFLIELIDAGDHHFLTKKVLDDMLENADKQGDVYVPSHEHIIVAKAEAYIDRNRGDPNKEKFFDDLSDIHEKMMVSGFASAVSEVFSNELSGTEQEIFLEGSGIPGDPYMIYDVNDLQKMSANLTAHYALVNDIDASETSGWNGGAGFEPIGDFNNRFTDSLYGQNFTINGLYIDRPSTNYVDLFGSVGSGGEFRNVVVDACGSGGNYVGGLVRYNYYSMVSNTYASGSHHRSSRGLTMHFEERTNR